MKRLDLFLAIVSLLVGLAVVGATLAEGGTGLSLGLVFGILLLMNSGVRFWTARKR